MAQHGSFRGENELVPDPGPRHVSGLAAASLTELHGRRQQRAAGCDVCGAGRWFGRNRAARIAATATATALTISTSDIPVA